MSSSIPVWPFLLLAACAGSSSNADSVEAAVTTPKVRITGDDANALARILATAGVPADGSSRTAFMGFDWDIGTPHGSSGSLFNPRPARAFVDRAGAPRYVVPDKTDATLIWVTVGNAGATANFYPDFVSRPPTPDGQVYVDEYVVARTEGMVTCTTPPRESATCMIVPSQSSTSPGLLNLREVLWDLLVNANAPVVGPGNIRAALVTFSASQPFAWDPTGPNRPERAEMKALDGEKLGEFRGDDLNRAWNDVKGTLSRRMSRTWEKTGMVTQLLACESSFGSIECKFRDPTEDDLVCIDPTPESDDDGCEPKWSYGLPTAPFHMTFDAEWSACERTDWTVDPTQLSPLQAKRSTVSKKVHFDFDGHNLTWPGGRAWVGDAGNGRWRDGGAVGRIVGSKLTIAYYSERAGDLQLLRRATALDCSGELTLSGHVVP